MTPKAHNKGFLCLVLHAHLPYIRHPEYDYFLEENWLYEAIIESYIPLFDMFSRLINDNVNFRITLSFSPTLIEMFGDELLMMRCRRHMRNLIELSEREIHRNKRDIHFGPIARIYYERFQRIRFMFEDVWKGNLISVLKNLQKTGHIDIITSAATHAFLPTLAMYPEAVKAQIKTGIWHYETIFGKRPEGIWLPECGFAPCFDNYMKEEGMRYFFLDTHGIIHGRPAPRYGVYAPILCPSGIAAFGRDHETSKQVWSSREGYPGDCDYRDFYRDVGFDIDSDHVRAFLHPFGARTYTGMKYYRVTGKTGRKEPYVPERARMRAATHASHFIASRESQTDYLSEILRIEPVITALYDAELFGHWWYEGPAWIEFLLRRIHSSKRNFRTVTPFEYLGLKGRNRPNLQYCEPAMSSWGERGYSEVWLNITNDYMYRHLHKVTERMIYLANRFVKTEGILQRSLNQAAREILLAQQSDWAFIMKHETSISYAQKRFEEHVSRFNILFESIMAEDIPEPWLNEIEKKDRIFQDLDYRVFCSGD